MKLKLGDTDIPFVFRGDELMYPNYIKDGLVLHYDFTGMTNDDTSRGIATDLSGNGNHGTLQNFNYTAESGYDKNKLLFDGVDDMIIVNDIVENFPIIEDFTIQIVYKRNTYTGTTIIFGNRIGIFEGAGGFGIELRSTRSGYSFYIDDGEIYVSNLFPYEDGQHGLITLTRKNGWFSTYINGNLERESDISEVGNILVKREIFIGSRPPGDLYKDDGELSSFKIYNKALTPEEIAHNYAIEKERFGIE